MNMERSLVCMYASVAANGKIPFADGPRTSRRFASCWWLMLPRDAVRWRFLFLPVIGSTINFCVFEGILFGDNWSLSGV